MKNDLHTEVVAGTASTATEPLLSVKEVARMLNFPFKRVYELGIPAVRLSARFGRWTGPKKALPHQRKKGYVIIRVGALLDFAKQSDLPLTNLRTLLLVEGHGSTHATDA